ASSGGWVAAKWVSIASASSGSWRSLSSISSGRHALALDLPERLDVPRLDFEHLRPAQELGLDRGEVGRGDDHLLARRDRRKNLRSARLVQLGRHVVEQKDRPFAGRLSDERALGDLER